MNESPEPGSTENCPQDVIGIIPVTPNFIEQLEVSGLADGIRQSLKEQSANCDEIRDRLQVLCPDIQMITGTAPVQIEGMVCPGAYLYFRARGFRWSLAIASSPDAAVEADDPENCFLYLSEPYGELNSFDASWMPHGEAYKIVELSVTKFLSELKNGAS